MSRFIDLNEHTPGSAARAARLHNAGKNPETEVKDEVEGSKPFANKTGRLIVPMGKRGPLTQFVSMLRGKNAAVPQDSTGPTPRTR